MTAAEAFEAVVEAVRNLAAMRGHELETSIVENRFSLTLQCRRCTRWVTIDLPVAANVDAEPGITGHVLGTCRGTPWGPPAVDPYALPRGPVDAGMIR